MRLISPIGALVSVSDEKGERLKRQGYHEVPDSGPAPAPEAPKRSRRKKLDSA